jgi:hypothetical protein
MSAPISCASCGYVFDPGVTRICPQCSRPNDPIWQPWIGAIRVLGIVGFLVVVGAPWQITVVAAALVAAYGLLRRNASKGPATREEVAEQDRNARSPNLLRVANMGVALSGALLFTSFLGSFVMFMNAREDAQHESVGTYHPSSFRVLQPYWQKGTTGTRTVPGSPTRAFARGLVEGKEEWMDLIPYLTFIPKDQETVARQVPVGTVLPVYYNQQLQGEYRVRLFGPVLPSEANRRTESLVAKYGILALLLTGLMLFGFLRLRNFSLGSA